MTGSASPDRAALAAFWQAAKNAAPDAVTGESYRTRTLGDSPERKRLILEAIRKGEKRGTFTLPWLLEKMPSATPHVGDYVILLDDADKPAALVTTTELEEVTYDTVTAAHTAIEGPSVRALDAWRAVHQPLWTQRLAAIGRTFANDMPVIVEHFKLLYPQTDPNSVKHVRFATLQANAQRPTEAALEAFWRAVKIARPDLALPDNFDVRCIGITQPISEIIFEHIASGLKTATFRPVALFKPTGQQPVKVGDCTVLVQYDGSPRMALRYVRVATIPFRAVTEEQIRLNGPPIQAGDTWHAVHRRIYGDMFARHGLTFTEDEPILAEIFELIYPQPLDTPIPPALSSERL